VLRLHRHSIENGVLRGAYLERGLCELLPRMAQLGQTAGGGARCFRAAAILSAEGAFVLGPRMGLNLLTRGKSNFLRNAGP